MVETHFFDAIIIGGGAAGLFCASNIAKHGKRVLVIESSNKFGKKILMSGGGHCNFTNLNIAPECYLSDSNLHFCKSALSKYTQFDFIKLVESYEIEYHEKKLGQLFCKKKSFVIVNMLLNECNKYNVELLLKSKVDRIVKNNDNNYNVYINSIDYNCASLVIATGGLSIPTLGSSDFGYLIAKQFGLNIVKTRAGLVPFTLDNSKEIYYKMKELSGISFDSCISLNDESKLKKMKSFSESSLLTHKGLSGPAMLQISSYWCKNQDIYINFIPNVDIANILNNNLEKKSLKSLLGQFLPKRLLSVLFAENLLAKLIDKLTQKDVSYITNVLTGFRITPSGTEGYKTAEVTLGGVDCNDVSSKNMECYKHKGLYFIGEVLDISGWLGGYNFQWAWSSGFAAAQDIGNK